MFRALMAHRYGAQNCINNYKNNCVVSEMFLKILFLQPRDLLQVCS
jgi:hypothetical protein